MSEHKLTQEILNRSISDTWDIAKLEWRLDEAGTCLCGHYPIIETCILQNIKNNNYATVGNCCVKKFIGLPSDGIFNAIKRVRKDITQSLNIEAIRHAHKKTG